MKSFTFSLAIVLAIYFYSGAAVENRGTDCVDQWSNCPELKDYCFDEVNNPDIRPGCPLTCGDCVPEATTIVKPVMSTDCKDIISNCAENKADGNCGSPKIAPKCQMTCGYCIPEPTTPIPTVNTGSMTVRRCNKCGESPENTYCKYEAGVLGPKCPNAWTEPVPESDKKILVDKHNELRSLVAKGKALKGMKAKNMRKLEWDDALAEGAQLWANQCDYGHDTDRDTCDGFVGQNGAWNAGGEELNSFQMAGVTERWYKEIENFTAAPKELQKSVIQKFKSGSSEGGIKKTGHFTQVIWAETTKIGCAAIAYDSSDPRSYITRELIHYCNYYPTGNMGDRPIFLTKGKCPKGTKRGKKDRLCALKKKM